LKNIVIFFLQKKKIYNFAVTLRKQLQHFMQLLSHVSEIFYCIIIILHFVMM